MSVAKVGTVFRFTGNRGHQKVLVERLKVCLKVIYENSIRKYDSNIITFAPFYVKEFASWLKDEKYQLGYSLTAEVLRILSKEGYLEDFGKIGQNKSYQISFKGVEAKGIYS